MINIKFKNINVHNDINKHLLIQEFEAIFQFISMHILFHIAIFPTYCFHRTASQT